MNFPEFVGLVKIQRWRGVSENLAHGSVRIRFFRVSSYDFVDRLLHSLSAIEITTPYFGSVPGVNSRVDIAQNQTVVALFESRREGCGTSMENVISARVISVCCAGGRIFIRFRI